MLDDMPKEPKAKVRISGTISYEIEIDPSYFDPSEFGGRIPSKQEMVKTQKQYIDESPEVLWENGEISDIKVELVE